MDDWQPIDTAPRDGTDVLLNAPHWPLPKVGNYHRIEHTIAATRRFTGWSGGWIGDPTHWKPIDA